MAVKNWSTVSTSSISAFADGGGGTVDVTTSAAHGLSNGDLVQISVTTNYNGLFIISGASGSVFTITATWVSDDATGTWGESVDESIVSGGDRASISVFESAHDGEIPTGSTICQGRVEGTHSGTVYFNVWQSGQNATTYVKVKAEPGKETTGLAASRPTGAAIAGKIWFFEATNVSNMEWSGIEHTDQLLPQADNNSSFTRVVNCWFDFSSPAYAGQFHAAGVGTGSVKIGGCLFMDNVVGTDDGYGVSLNDADPTLEAVNCTTVGNGVGFQETLGSVTCTNCAGADSNTNAQATDFSAGVAKTTCFWENDASPNMDGTDFADKASDDYRPSSGSALDGITTALPSWYTDITSVDMAGVTWNTSDPTAGCYQLVAAGAPTVAHAIIGR